MQLLWRMINRTITKSSKMPRQKLPEAILIRLGSKEEQQKRQN